MNREQKATFIYDSLYQLFPDAHCELNYRNGYELITAVVLSAQTTDKSVNRVTEKLFESYPTASALANAKQSDVESIIHSIGLYHNKSKNIIQLAKELDSYYDGVVPNSIEQLTKLSGVGRKTANVVVSELYETPAIAVDTHVSRVAKRLKIAKVDDDVLEIEKKLMKMFPKENWHKLHHLMIFFGRYHCMAKNPKCEDCPLEQLCRKNKNV